VNVLVLTDLHLSSARPAGRIGDYAADVDKKLEEVVEIANTYSAEAVLCAGDLFHKPDVSFSAVSRFLSFLEKLSRRFITIAGSHDLFGNNLDSLHRTAIGVLDRLGCVELLRAERNPKTEVGPISVGIVGSGVAGIELAHGAILAKPDFGEYTLLGDYVTKAAVVVVGHYHNGYEIISTRGHVFVCPGSLVRVSASEGEILRIPRVAIVSDDYKVTWVQLSSAKPGSAVLQRPIVVPRIDFVDFVRTWRVAAFEDMDADALLAELGITEAVDPQVVVFARKYLKEKRDNAFVRGKSS